MGNGTERRQWARRTPGVDDPLRKVKVRIGPELTVIDVCGHGVLVEARTRLTPGARVDLHVLARNGRVLVRSTVMRAWVSQLRSDAVTYRAGIRFDHPIELGA
jgi:hypothetical protein